MPPCSFSPLHLILPWGSILLVEYGKFGYSSCHWMIPCQGVIHLLFSMHVTVSNHKETWSYKTMVCAGRFWSAKSFLVKTLGWKGWRHRLTERSKFTDARLHAVCLIHLDCFQAFSTTWLYLGYFCWQNLVSIFFLTVLPLNLSQTLQSDFRK